MPIYLFENPNTGETKEILLSIHDEHEYIENGTVWKRVFSPPQISTDTQIDPRSSEDFVNKTARKKGTIGDLWDTSAELSQKRVEKDGVDPLKSKWQENWSKKRNGRKMPKYFANGVKES